MAPNDDSDLEMTSYWAYYQLLWTTPTLPVAAQVIAQPYKAYKAYKYARRLLFGQSELQRLLYHAQLDETTRLWLSEHAIRCSKVLTVCSPLRLAFVSRCAGAQDERSKLLQDSCSTAEAEDELQFQLALAICSKKGMPNASVRSIFMCPRT
jgi:hypothetical protein